MNSDFLERNLQNAGCCEDTQLVPLRALPCPRGGSAQLVSSPSCPQSSWATSRAQPGTRDPQPTALGLPGHSCDQRLKLGRHLHFSRKEKLGPSSLKYITLAGSAISTVFATSPKCIFKDSFKNCFDVDLCNSDAIQQLSDDDQHCALCEIRNLKIIIKLLGLMGDETRVIHQQKINPWWNPQCWNFNGQEWSRLEEKPKPPVEEWNMIWSKMYP